MTEGKEHEKMKMQRLDDGSETTSEVMSEDSEEGCWSQLPKDVLWMVAEKLSCMDLIQLPDVCQDWYISLISHPTKFPAEQPQLPWLMLSENVDSTTRIFANVFDHMAYTINLPEFYGTTCLSSREGWLLLQRGWTLFLFNPFSRDTIYLPKLANDSAELIVATFSTFCGLPHHVFVVVSDPECMLLYMCVCGQKDWDVYLNPSGGGRRQITAVLCKGNLYCTDTLASLFVFNVKNQKWRNIDGEQSMRKLHDKDRRQCRFGQTAECGGELFRVSLILLDGCPVVFWLNRTKLAWEEWSFEFHHHTWFVSGKVHEEALAIHSAGMGKMVSHVTCSFSGMCHVHAFSKKGDCFSEEVLYRYPVQGGKSFAYSKWVLLG